MKNPFFTILFSLKHFYNVTICGGGGCCLSPRPPIPARTPPMMTLQYITIQYITLLMTKEIEI